MIGENRLVPRASHNFILPSMSVAVATGYNELMADFPAVFTRLNPQYIHPAGTACGAECGKLLWHAKSMLDGSLQHILNDPNATGFTVPFISPNTGGVERVDYMIQRQRDVDCIQRASFSWEQYSANLHRYQGMREAIVAHVATGILRRPALPGGVKQPAPWYHWSHTERRAFVGAYVELLQEYSDFLIGMAEGAATSTAAATALATASASAREVEICEMGTATATADHEAVIAAKDLTIARLRMRARMARLRNGKITTKRQRF